MRLFLFFLFAILFSSAPFLSAALPQPGETVNLDQELAGPAKVYTSEEDREAFTDEALRADVVFTGLIETSVLSRMGFGGPPVPITRLGFKDIEVLKGGPLEGRSFLYRKSPDSVRAFHEIPAIVLLKHANDASRSLFVENIIAADPASVALVRSAVAGNPARKAAVDEALAEVAPEPSCGEETSCSETAI